jgi:predicted DCC family thiol-disulfide oxidoreductase YuxK
MKPIHQTLHDFWFETAPPARLALLRIIVGVYSLFYLVPEYDDLLKVSQTDPRLFAPVGVVFHGPLGLELFRWLLRATLVCTACFTVGLWHRITGPAFGALLLWLLCYRNSWSMIYHSDNLMVLHAIVLGLTRSSDVLSLDSFLRRLRRPGTALPAQPGWQYGWPVRLMCAITVSAYFVTAIAKLSGPLGLSWITGRALRSQMAVDQIRKELFGGTPNPVSYALYDWLPLFSLLGAGSLALEFFAPLALVNRRIGRIWALNTFLMHWGILLVMRITFLYQLSGVIFAPFFRVERLLELPRTFFKKRSSTGAQEPLPGSADAMATQSQATHAAHATLFYDGECGLCDRFVQFVLRHDRREYFQFAPLQSPAGRQQLARLGLPQDQLSTVILLEEGNPYMRSTATLRVCRRLAGFWPLLYGFILVPKPWRDAAYALVARNRRRWFRPPDQCPVMPAEWRRRFVA